MGSSHLIWKQITGITVAATLAGCGDVTGDGPKIASNPTPTPVSGSPATSSTSAAPITSPSPSAGSSGWNQVAHQAFQSTASEARLAASITDRATSAASAAAAQTPSGPPPEAPTAPDPGFAESSSLYIRQALKSKVNWRAWSPDSFREAQARQVPVLIVIGTSWSHDARLMDLTVFSDPEISAYLNTNYVTIRVDADERPDIWSRYRLAYEMVNKQRARLPLSAFALPDGRPFDVVSAMPARGDGKVAGMLELLQQAQPLLKTQTEEVTKQAASIDNVLSKLLTEPRAESSTLSAELLDTLASEFSNMAKGDTAEEIRAGRIAQTLLAHGANTGSTSARDTASELLLSRFRSGQRDHVMGGYFFRVPGNGDIQFGKLLPVQAEMISANAEAYAATGKTLHKEAVTEVLRFCRDWLESSDGGFYSGQSPDVAGDDSGGYFTWTREEIASLAGDEKAATVFSEYLNAKAGEKSNLHVTGKLQQAADTAGVSYEEANKDLNAVRTKLHDARMGAEQVPMVDKSILAGWNGDMICAYLDAAKYIGDEKAREFALKTADMIIESMVSEQEGVAHVIYKGRASGFGYLEDNVKVAAGLVRCYEATSQQEYLDSAVSLMEYVEARFLDKSSGLYQDVLSAGAANDMGLLKLKRLPLEDDIARSANAVAALVWLRLSVDAKKPEYKQRAERMVKAAIERRSFNTEAIATWGQAAEMVQYGIPEFKR